MPTAISVPLLVGGVLLLNLAIWIPLLFWIRARTKRLVEELGGELRTNGERILCAPEPGLFRGGHAEGIRGAKGNCVVALTDRRLVFRKVVGAGGEVAVDRILGVREERWFRGSAVGGQMHLVLMLDGGDEIAFFFRDNAHWQSALRQSSARLATR
jgi:hypothetical protein